MSKQARIPSYRRHSSGQATVRIHGKDFYLGTYGTAASRREYDRLINEWLANGRRLAVTQADPVIAVVELIAAFWEHAKTWYVKNGQPTDELAAYKVVLRYLRQDYENQPVTEFGPRALRAVRQKMIDRGNARKYINDQVARLKRVFRWGVAQELVPETVSRALDTVDGLVKGRCDAREKPPVGPVPDAVVEATMPHMSPVVADMVRFQRLTGCRPQEVCAMRPVDIDRSDEIWVYTPARHKTEHHGKGRQIFIGPKAQSLLAKYLLRGENRPCFDSPRTRGRGFCTRAYRDAIHRACDRAFPVPENLLEHERAAWQREHRWQPNQLRHLAATEIRKCFGLEAAQVALGHASANVTQIYAERDAEKAVAVMRQIG